MHEISFVVSNGTITHRFGNIELGLIQSGCRYLSGYGLTIPLKVVAQPLAVTPESAEIPLLSEIIGTFHIGGQQDLLAPLLPAVFFQSIRQFSNYPSPSQLSLDVMLSHEQLMVLEDVRAREGGDLAFGVKLSLRFDGLNPVRKEIVHLQARIAQSEWLKVLKSTKFADRIMVEIPVGADATELQGAVKSYREAQDHFRHGRYTECITACRKAIEQLNAHMDRDGAVPDGDHKPGRLKRIRNAVKDFTNPSAHSEKFPRTWYEYDRHDAEFVLGVVAALMRSCDAPSKA